MSSLSFTASAFLLFPGDRFYPLDASGQTEADDMTDFQLKDPLDDSALHRIVALDPYIVTLQVTITPKYNHLRPLMEPAISRDSKSPL